MTTTADTYTRAIIADMVWNCLGCGDKLPPHRSGHCDACVEWQDDRALAAIRADMTQDDDEDTPIDYSTPPADAPGQDCPDHGPYADDDCPKCSTCNNSGTTCFDCGALELSALGRKLRDEMRDDRPALLRRLRSTPRRFWKVHAHAYALEIGGTPSCDRQPTEPGILWLWTTLERESA